MTDYWRADALLTPEAMNWPGIVAVADDGTVTYAGASLPAEAGSVHELPDGCRIVPGFIDIHTHGGTGITFGRGEDFAADLHTYSEWVASTGVTGFLCSIAAPNTEALRQMVRTYADAFEAGGFPGAVPLGLHLEGPYLNPEKRGAFNETWLRGPLLDEVEALIDAGRGWVRQMTLAPELPGAFEVAERLGEAGIVAALGHSDTDYAEAARALRGPFVHVTHTFNAQRGFHHRRPGVLGAVLASDGVTAELIADTVHVHPAAMRVLLRCLGPDRVVLITDAMAGAGLGEGHYELTGHDVWVKDGEARQANGTLAGSVATLDLCVRNLVDHVGVPLLDAVRMATTNPARVLATGDGRGRMVKGAPGDMVVLDEALRVMLTLVQGRVVYRAPGYTLKSSKT
jgi:N-acetylglucosamine-6-phosphate deacetylase